LLIEQTHREKDGIQNELMKQRCDDEAGRQANVRDNTQGEADAVTREKRGTMNGRSDVRYGLAPPHIS